MFCVSLSAFGRHRGYYDENVVVEAESSISIHFSVRWDNPIAIEGILGFIWVSLCGVHSGDL